MSTTGLYKTLFPCFIEIPEFNGNNVDYDKMLCSAASDLGLHCLPMPLLWDAILSTLSKCSLKMCLISLLSVKDDLKKK